MNRFFGIALVVVALAIAIVPQFTDCESQGKMITLANGKQISMKCHWTARAEIAIGAPLVIVGGMLAASRRKESQRNLAILGIGLGALTMLTPTYLIGVCTTPTMTCYTAMRPALLAAGGLAAAVSVVALVMTQRKKELLD